MSGTIAIVLYVLRAIVTISGILVANIVLKYFKQKALGMQTILDDMIKDKIYLSLLSCMFAYVMDVTLEYAIPLNHYVAVPIFLCHQIIIISELWQLIVIAIIRYLSVFYHPLLNMIDESFLKRTTRTFVVFMSILLELMGDLDNANLFILLTEKFKTSENLLHSKSFFWATVLLSITSVFTHYKIEKFKKHVDSQREFDQLEKGEESQEINATECELGMNTGRILVSIGCVINTIVIVYMFQKMDDHAIRRHEALLLIHFFNLNVIPMILVMRNENIFNFFKNEIKMYCLFILHYPLIVLNVIVCNRLE